MLNLVCDRCDKTETSVTASVFVGGSHPEANSLQRRITASADLPNGWKEIEGKHLCVRCVRDMEEFLSPRRSTV